MEYSCLFVVCVLYAFLTSSALGKRYVGGDYTFELPDKEKTCFSEIFTDTSKILFEFKVIRGGNNDVNVRVVSPTGKIVYKQEKMSGDIVTMEPTLGEWKYCFNNEFSSISHKTIFFSIRPFNVDSLSKEAGEKQVPTVKVAAEMSMDEIHVMMSHVKEFQTRYRLRESIGRHIAEQLNGRVMWWSLAQAVIVMLTGFGQVMIFKTFFTERRKSSKQGDVEK
ncbi:transmembrane emp24 domain-containing protein 7-like [Haliotis rubra]|uniref:transmembrane emp24 domain-containing protein 7-like n=1 Tax=Haliotis rubra TaxID=36100 RepID=UPI001EE61112|nr:transmembrane emp24 domain-containing protein 7-like [Haliotis rubra]